MSAQLGEHLGGRWSMTHEEWKAAQLNTRLVDRAVETITVSKQCRTVEERMQYHIGVGHFVFPRESMLYSAVAARLNVHPGTRSKPREGGFSATTPDLSTIEPPPFDGTSCRHFLVPRDGRFWNTAHCLNACWLGPAGAGGVSRRSKLAHRGARASFCLRPGRRFTCCTAHRRKESLKLPCVCLLL